MGSSIDLLINILIKSSGDGAKKAASAFRRLKNASDKAVTGMADSKAALDTVTQGFQQAGAVVTSYYNAVSEGAALELQASQFDNLTKSIGTTSDALMDDLRVATKGMVADSELLAGASQIISLGLTDSHDATVRLGTAVATLGLDMNQVILTMANDSKLRLDSLGLSIKDVDEKTRKYTDAGMEMSQAFDLGVLDALEDRMLLLGDASETTAGKMKKLESNWKNLTDTTKQWLATRVEPVITGVVNIIDAYGSAQDELNILVERGVITQHELNVTLADAASGYGFAQDELARYREEAARLEAATLKTSEAFNEQEFAFVKAQHAAAAYADSIRPLERINEELNEKIERGAHLLTEEEAAIKSANQANSDYFKGIEEGNAAMLAHQEAIDAQTESMRAYNQVVSDAAFDSLPEIHDANKSSTDSLLEVASAAGITASQFVMLAGATGSYTDAQIEAALEAGAMKAKIEELGQSLSDGTTTVSEALQELRDFEANLADTDQAAIAMGSSVGEAFEKLDEIPEPDADPAMLKFFQDMKEVSEDATVTLQEVYGALKDVEAEPPDLSAVNEVLKSMAEDAAEAESTVSAIADALNSLDTNILIRISTDTSGVDFGAVSAMTAAGRLGGEARASGGSVSGGRPYVVGEHGPELFIPSQNGNVVPNNQMGGGASTIVYANTPEAAALVLANIDVSRRASRKGFMDG